MDTSSAISVTSDESDATCATPTNALTTGGGGGKSGATTAFEENHFARSAALLETASDNVSDIDISEEHRGSEIEAEGEAESGED